MTTWDRKVEPIRIPGGPSKFGCEDIGAFHLLSLLESGSSALLPPRDPGTSTQDTVPTARPRDVTKRN